MKIKNVEGIQNNIPCLGNFSIDEIKECNQQDYQRLQESFVLDAIKNQTHVFLDGNDNELTMQQSLNLFNMGPSIWCVCDGLIQKEDFLSFYS